MFGICNSKSYIHDTWYNSCYLVTEAPPPDRPWGSHTCVRKRRDASRVESTGVSWWLVNEVQPFHRQWNANPGVWRSNNDRRNPGWRMDARWTSQTRTPWTWILVITTPLPPGYLLASLPVQYSREKLWRLVDANARLCPTKLKKSTMHAINSSSWRGNGIDTLLEGASKLFLKPR
jgi:hypothetical protein